MGFDPKLLSLVIYYHPDSLDCWRNRKVLTEFVNVTGLDCSYVSVAEWSKADIKKAKIDTVPRTQLIYDGKDISQYSGRISSPEVLIGWINASFERAGYK